MPAPLHHHVPTPPSHIPSVTTSIYLQLRRVVRGFFIRHPTLDRLVGRQLVAIDVAFHERGVLRHLRRSDRLDWNGFTLFYGPPDIGLINQLYLHGEYELATQKLMADVLKPGMTFVDLGAHIGLFTLLAARLVGPTGRVFAFEPTPRTRALLQRNIAINGMERCVTVAPLATSDKKAKVRFVENPISDASSVAQPDETEHIIEVDATSLDDYFGALGFPPVHFIKMDVEGQELKTLLGMAQVVAKNPDVKVVFEYHRAQMARCQIAPADLFGALKKLGFSRYSVLFRECMPLELPSRLAELDDMAKRANMNVLAER
jgi:FkbM family methyltransferase